MQLDHVAFAGDAHDFAAHGHGAGEQRAAAQLGEPRVVNPLVHIRALERQHIFAPELLDVDQRPLPAAEREMLQP